MATISRLGDRERESLRRSALGGDQGPSERDQAGVLDLVNLFRRVYGGHDPQDPTNVSFPFLRRMRRDHIIAMALHFINMPIVNSSWYYECHDAQVASYADHLVRPIFGDLVQTILRFLWAGYSPGAYNYDTIQPGWTYFDGGEAKKVWDNGTIDAVIIKNIIPLKPETAMISWDASGNFNGIDYDARYGVPGGSFIIDGRRTPTIDREHSFWATHDKMWEDGSPYGFPRIAHCAPIFYMYRYIWDLLARAFENSADPGPVVRYPSTDRMTDDDGVQVDPVKRALYVGTKRRTGSTTALPSDVWTDFQDKPTSVSKWSIEYPKGDTDFEHLISFMGYLDAAKFRGVWLPEQGLTEGVGGSSSRNVASEMSNQRDASQESLMRQIMSLIDETIVAPVISMVFPNFSGELQMKTVGFGDNGSDLVRQVFQLVGQQDWRQFGINMRRIAESQGFPMLDPDEQQRQLQQAVQQANTSQPPVVTPTQGRRALVTQTGFGETSYHQLGDELSLEDVALEATHDGDFVQSLPSTDVFADTAVTLEARRMRARNQAFLAWAYRDFAIFLRKRDKELLADDAEELLKPGPVEIAQRLVRSWLPPKKKLEDHARATSTSLRRVFSAAVGAHGRRLGKYATIDDAAAAWLSQHGAEMVTQILSTTREQLADALADGVRQGRSAEQIAADITSHFESFPASRAAVIARTEVPRAYNYATVAAGRAAKVARAQLVDGNGDPACVARNGRIVTLDEAAQEDLNHPQCRFFVRLLPGAPTNLSVRRETLSDGYGARYDEETATVLLSPDLSEEDEAKFMLALASAFL